MKINSRRTAKVLVFLLMVLAALAYAFHFRWKWGAENYKRQLLAAGEKLTVDELIPPPVPPEQNSAAIFLKAADEIKRHPTLLDTNPPGAMRMVAPGKAMIGWTMPDIRSDEATNTWEEAEADLSLNHESLELLRQIIERPAFDFKLRYQEGDMLRLPHLAPMKRASEFLAAATICYLHRGDTASAVKNTRAMLALVKGTQKEPIVISQLTRIAMSQLALTVAWELLQSPNSTDGELVALQHDWMDLEFIQAAENALSMEPALSEATLNNLRSSNSPISVIKGPYRDNGRATGRSGDWLADTLWRVSWSYTDELCALRTQQALIDGARQIHTNGFFKDALLEKERKLKAAGSGMAGNNWNRLWDKIDEPIIDGPPNLREFLSVSLWSDRHFLNDVMTVEVAKQMAITAVALKRYQLRNGNYPPTLKALVPQFLPAVPRDPVDGNPLRYQQSGKTFMLYSIGEDGRDNGGDPTIAGSVLGLDWLKGRDIVWPQPASPQEIAAYYQILASPNHKAGATPAK
jgi:hypothetical protein